MKKDEVALFEAYISATQKGINVPGDNISVNTPDTEGEIELRTEPVTAVVSVEEPDEECSCNDHDHSEEEHEESSMAKTNLFSIFKNAKMIHDYIESGVHLETWMLQKIAVVADNLNSVAKVAEYHAAKGAL